MRGVLDVPLPLVIKVSNFLRKHRIADLVQGVIAPDGTPLWISDVLPGAAHDITAARERDRVRCLHALVAHELAAPGVNPFGRQALTAMGQWWSRGPCVSVPEAAMPEAGDAE